MTATESYFREHHRWMGPASGPERPLDAAADTIERAQDRQQTSAVDRQRTSAVAVPASLIRRRRVEWLQTRRIPLGALTILVGEQGLGKSLFTCTLAASLSRGELPCGKGSSLFLTAEDSPEFTVRPRLEAAGADLEQIAFARLTAAGLDADLELPRHVDELARLVTETGAMLVVIDPLTAHLAGANTWRDSDVRGALAPLQRIADSSRAAVLALLHLNKGHCSDPLRRTGGSVAFTAAARSVLLMARDPDDPEAERGRRRVLAHVKCNIGPLAPSLAFELRPILLPADGDEPELETVTLAETGESPRSGSELLAAAGMDGDERSALGEAVAFLREALADGARSAAELKREAKELGIAGRTLDRARSRLGIESRREGFGGGYFWHPNSCIGDGEHADCGEHAENGSTTPIPASANHVLAKPDLHGERGEQAILEEVEQLIAEGVLVEIETP
jgi:hypothetical protein